uniref:Uncharacterized protein n=1 Tax=Astatotilapia calliptera TaxID=8154 RepID=A0AAX7ST81_ASTCA
MNLQEAKVHLCSSFSVLTPDHLLGGSQGFVKVSPEALWAIPKQLQTPISSLETTLVKNSPRLKPAMNWKMLIHQCLCPLRFQPRKKLLFAAVHMDEPNASWRKVL